MLLEWLPWLLLMNRPGKKFKKPKKPSIITKSDDLYLSRKEQQKDRCSITSSFLVSNCCIKKQLANYDAVPAPTSLEIHQRVIGRLKKPYSINYKQSQQALIDLSSSAFKPINNKNFDQKIEGKQNLKHTDKIMLKKFT